MPYVALLAGCATHSATPPLDAGGLAGRAPTTISPTNAPPLPSLVAVHAALARACNGVSTMTAELSLSGRAGRQRIRGRVLAGFASPDGMRLEGVSPFGAPAFIMVSRGGASTLLLPRENAAIAGAAPRDVLGALVGVPLSPADLLAVLTGCVEPAPVPTVGTLDGKDDARLGLAGGAVLRLTRRGSRAGQPWRLLGASTHGWEIDYVEWRSTFPRAVRLRSTDGVGDGADSGGVDLVVRPGQLETNVTLDANAFRVEVPASARRLSLDEVRELGPLRGAP